MTIETVAGLRNVTILQKSWFGRGRIFEGNNFPILVHLAGFLGKTTFMEISMRQDFWVILLSWKILAPKILALKNPASPKNSLILQIFWIQKSWPGFFNLDHIFGLRQRKSLGSLCTLLVKSSGSKSMSCCCRNGNDFALWNKDFGQEFVLYF